MLATASDPNLLGAFIFAVVFPLGAVALMIFGAMITVKGGKQSDDA